MIRRNTQLRQQEPRDDVAQASLAERAPLPEPHISARSSDVGVRAWLLIGTEPSATNLRRWFWLAAILLGAIQVWTYRYTLSTDDSVSYLDIADAYLRGDWHAALNTHWSPLYSWLLALALYLLKPAPYWELAVVKLVNFLIYLGALAAFDFFLRTLIEHNDRQLARDSENGFLKVPHWVWIVSGYLLLLWSTHKWTALFSDTPDLATSLFVYVAAGILLRGGGATNSWLHFLLLGSMLGLAYLSKTALLPISSAFLAGGLVSAKSFRQGFTQAVVAGLALAAVSAPFVAALSIKEGRFTFGDVGKYTYAVFVNPGGTEVPWFHWQGGRPEFGTPLHAERKIYESPTVFEFGTPIAGSYPPWYEPSYWYAGVKIRFNLKQQLWVLARNMWFAWTTFLGALTFAYLALVYGGGRLRASLAALKSNAAMLVPAVAGLAAYLLSTDLSRNDIVTQPVMRYIAPFVVLLSAGVFSSVRLADSKESRRWLAAMLVAASAFVGASLIANPVRDWVQGPAKRDHVNWQIAEGLASLGVVPGDAIAIMGYDDPRYWARLAKVRIVAEIADEKDFWSHSAPDRAAVLRAIKKTGATAVVAPSRADKPDTVLAEGWQKARVGNVYVYLFEPE